MQIELVVIGCLWFMGQDIVIYVDWLFGSFKFIDFYLFFIFVQLEVDVVFDFVGEVLVQLVDMLELVCLEVCICNDGDGFIFWDGIMQVVKEVVLYIVVLCQFCGDNFIYKWQ